VLLSAHFVRRQQHYNISPLPWGRGDTEGWGNTPHKYACSRVQAKDVEIGQSYGHCFLSPLPCPPPDGGRVGWGEHRPSTTFACTRLFGVQAKDVEIEQIQHCIVECAPTPGPSPTGRGEPKRKFGEGCSFQVCVRRTHTEEIRKSVHYQNSGTTSISVGKIISR